MLKIIIILLLLFPAVIYSQPDYLKKGDKISDYQIYENNPQLNKEYHVKTRTKWKISPANKKIKTEMLKYNTEGNLTGWIIYNVNEEKPQITSYKYNSNGLLNRIINGYYETNSVEIFEYDVKDRLVKGIVKSKHRRDSTIYIYDDITNSILKLQFMKDMLIYKTLRHFNENDFVVKNIYNDKTDTTITEYTYYPEYTDETIYEKDKTVSKHRVKFDSNNNETESSLLTADSTFQVQHTSEFSSLNKKVKETFFEKGKELYRNEWKYDDKGNVTEKVYFELGMHEYKTTFRYNTSGLVTEEETDFMATDAGSEKTIYTYKYY